ncbi:hypothetical protein J2X66_001939 [Pseudomonas sp. 3296]|uniref:hypothetical protein n=1 Tax=Pseudomonas sp. 3296 TaxID=2817753 RepID=UPI0028541FAE|nr:hypothetical protein [Pseudomonas sp. 3296]MDR6915074.1 hypothetical protein [Pseudomonas sp. 3296]
MTEKKQTTPWKERHTAEKTTLIVGWCLIAVLMVYGFLPSKPEPTEPSQTLVSEAAPPTALHTIASAEALTSATHYLSHWTAPWLKAYTYSRPTNSLNWLLTAEHSKPCLKPATSSLVVPCFNRWARAAQRPSLPTAGGTRNSLLHAKGGTSLFPAPSKAA